MMPDNSHTAVAAPKPLGSFARFPGLHAAADQMVRHALRFENPLYEHRLGISTHGLFNWLPGNEQQNEHLYYVATSYRRIFRILNALHLGPSDTFIDLWCGRDA